MFNNALLKERRKIKGLTQYDASKIIGVARTTYADYENGKIQPPIDKIRKISEWLDLPLEKLMNIQQRLICMNKKEYKPKAPQEEYIFSGMIKCKECGGSFNSNRIFRSGKCYKFYRCQRAKREKNCSNQYTISEKGILETYLLNHIKDELSKYKVSYEVKQASKDVSDIASQLTKCRNKLEKLKDLYLDDLIDKDAYKAEYARLNGTIAELEKELDSDMDMDAVNTILNMDFEGIYNTLQPNEKRYIWQAIIDYIEVGDNREDITIHFR